MNITEGNYFYHKASLELILAQQIHKSLRKYLLQRLITELEQDKDKPSKIQLERIETINLVKKIIQIFCTNKFQQPILKQQQLNQLKVPIDMNEDPKLIEKPCSNGNCFYRPLK